MKGMKINLKATGLEGISANLDKFISNLTSNVFDAAKESAEMVRMYANSKYAPVDTGYMVETSFDVNIMVGGNPGAEIVYTAPYSFEVEDNPYYAHGASFNIKHAEEIAMGIEHERKPTERYMFLAQAVLDKYLSVFNNFKQAGENVTV
jgi:hypothetical protein